MQPHVAALLCKMKSTSKSAVRKGSLSVSKQKRRSLVAQLIAALAACVQAEKAELLAENAALKGRVIVLDEQVQAIQVRAGQPAGMCVPAQWPKPP